MCGIAGILSKTTPVSATAIEAMADGLAHRGPDGDGFLFWRPDGDTNVIHESPSERGYRLALAHRRLAIIDLSDAARQPMTTSDRRYCLLFNGEIYNYIELREELKSCGTRFHTRSDSEVFLQAFVTWGCDAFTKIRGMFACAIVDFRERELVLARDHFGIKPLYVAENAGRLAFASEIAPLRKVLGCGQKPDRSSVFDYLVNGRSDASEHTFFDGITQVPAASWVSISLQDLTQVSSAKYWSPGVKRARQIDCSTAHDEFRAAFHESLRLHMRSDVPIAASLSGGLDSSSIVCALQSLKLAVRSTSTFSYFADDSELSEREWVEAVLHGKSLRNHGVTARGFSLWEVEKLMSVQGEPVASSSVLVQSYICAAVRAAGYKVVLDGQGADEYLGGYPTFLASKCAALVRRGQFGTALQLLFSKSVDQTISPLGLFARMLWRTLNGGVSPSRPRPGWLGPGLRKAQPHASPMLDRGIGPLHAHLVESLTQTSLPALLRYLDRNSMANSIESRVPFLDWKLVEFALSLPDQYLIDNRGRTKAILRDSMKDIVPHKVLARSDKIGFTTPERRWMRDSLDWLRPTLASGDEGFNRIVDPAAVHHSLRQLEDDIGRCSYPVWRWLSLVVWSRQHEVQFAI